MKKALPSSYATISATVVIAALLTALIAAYFNAQTGQETVKLLKTHEVSWEILRHSQI